MAHGRYDLTEFEWKSYSAVAAEQATRSAKGRRPAGLERHLLPAAIGLTLGGFA